MWRMLQRPQADDFVIATGESHSLQEFVELVFGALDLDWREYTVVSNTLFRPTDISEGRGDAGKAQRLLEWRAQAHLPEVITKMVAAELESMPPPGT
jgi:GDPmannose 4,6-dehydratase